LGVAVDYLAKLLSTGLLVWFGLLLALVAVRILRRDINVAGLLSDKSAARGEQVLPERVLSMAVFPSILIYYVIIAMHADQFRRCRIFLTAWWSCSPEATVYIWRARSPEARRRVVNPQNIALYSFVVISFILLAFAALVLWKIFKGDIDLSGLLTDPGQDGKASLSRFQFLIFTFVIAGLFLLLSIEAGTFVDVPNNVLVLLGISGGSYLVSKGMPQKTGG
jgi:hypothetical protein